MNRLVKLSADMEREYMAYMAEWENFGGEIVPMASNHRAFSFSEFLKGLPEYETEEGCPKNFVPGTTWFYVNDAGRILGALNLRHRLNEYLLATGGHIGYGVRPSERRRGYASQMLALALEEAKKMGIPKVLITCDKENTGSARTIQKNGGVLENEVPEEGRITQRYWIALQEEKPMKEVTLKDGRVLTLRRVQEDDAEAMLPFLNAIGGESDFLIFEKDGCKLTAEQEKSWIRAQGQKNSVFLVGILDGELVATAQLAAAQRNKIAHTSEMAIVVRKAYWHLGAGTALLEELIRFAKEETLLKVIHLGVHADNARAISLYQKFGFQEIGRYPKFFQVNGSYYDEILMNLYL